MSKPCETSFWHPLGSWAQGPRVCLIAGLLWLAASAAMAQTLKFYAQVDRSNVTVGDTLVYRAVIEHGDRKVRLRPAQPDFGGLQSRGRSNSDKLYEVNRRVRIVSASQWELRAVAEGEFTIGPSTVTVDGQTYQTNSVTVTVTRQTSDKLPAQLQGEAILFARSNNAEVNRLLEGRLFLRTVISNQKPYVGEVVVISYELYNEGIGIQPPFNEQVAPVQGVVMEEIFHAREITPKPKDFGDRTFQVAPLYQIALIANKPGELNFDGYGLTGSLPRSRRSGNSIDNLFNDPFFGPAGIEVEMPTIPIRLDVRPLPTAGQPQGFTGTVGDFTLEAELDRQRATTDDYITLKLTLSGRGAIELANAPRFPESEDFDRVGEDAAVEKQVFTDGIGGRKTFEYVLRPRQTGTLTIPPIRYGVFNPETESYRVLETRPLTVQVRPGTSGLPLPVDPASDLSESAGDGVRNLTYLQTIDALRTRRSSLLINRPIFWGAMIAALGLLMFCWRRDRRLARLDPARVRREGARRRFEKQMQAFRHQADGGHSPEELAAGLEMATRACIADHFNLSADGLTRYEIEKLLIDAAAPRERVRRLCDLIDQCAAMRYAPLREAGGDIREWSNEIAAILKEELQ